MQVLESDPPYAPRQTQEKGAILFKICNDPEAQASESVGGAVRIFPLLEPQFPVCINSAWQRTLPPPLLPAHCQVQGPVPEKATTVPIAQSPTVGVETCGDCSPQTPFSGGDEYFIAWHFADEPPSEPKQAHVSTPCELVESTMGVPELHKFKIGPASKIAVPLAAPQVPTIF